MNRDRGELALVFHTHMPYVEGFGTWPFGEEWLWEAIATSYLRLLDVFAGAPVTIGLTPVLCDQFATLGGPAGDRCANFLGTLREDVYGEEIEAFDKRDAPAVASELRRARDDYRQAAARFEAIGRDLNGAFAALAAAGAELWTSAATHAILPLVATGFGADLQVSVGVDAHRRRFGAWGGGFWLPECAYVPGIEYDLARHGVSSFCVDQTAVHGRDSSRQLAPVALPAGPVAVPIDWSTVALVWEDGYPSGGPYRDTFRRTRLDLFPWNNDGDVYDEAAARRRAALDAEHFVGHVTARLDAFAAEAGEPGLCVCALDTELLGHWWYEGPWWLAAVVERARDEGLPLTTVGAAVERRDPAIGVIDPSSWGERKDLSTWDSPAVADLVWAARRAELALFDAVPRGGAAPDPGFRAAAMRAARELLATQSSDWAFMARRGLAGDYPRSRASGHRERFEAALAVMSQSPGSSSPEALTIAAELAHLAPGLTFERLSELRCAY